MSDEENIIGSCATNGSLIIIKYVIKLWQKISIVEELGEKNYIHHS